MENELIYLDYNATTPIDPAVADAMRPFLDTYFGNPSSSHKEGVITRKAVEKSRQQIAELINCNPAEIVFTSGGTESNNYAIKGAAFFNRNKGKHIITTAIEHPAVLEVCDYLKKDGFEISRVGVDEFGMVDPEEIERSIRPDTILISVMHANNEVGTIQAIDEIGRIAKKHKILMHCDAAQSMGKIEVDVEQMQVDLLSIAGHKLYAPKGIGALYIRQGIQLEKLIHGADHERNLRAGTENVLEIVGLGKACELARINLSRNQLNLSQHRDKLHNGLKAGISGMIMNGHPEQRLPNTLSLSFKGVEANTLLSELDGIAASAGAACHAENVEVSAVLEAMTVPLEFAMGTIRFSVGKYTTEAEIDKAIMLITKSVKNLQVNEDDKQIVVSHGEQIKLTKYTHGLGCACKLRPQELEKILSEIPVLNNPDILVGVENSDDAAVVKLSDDQALVQTLDFFTPIVDDPYEFGAIAAANSLSDIYAMGAKPLFALNIVGFPSTRLPMSVLKDILQGASDKAKEAGIPILGGHTVDDTEPKYGMAVSGLVHPDKIYRNSTARAGDVLILTKPIGTGILATALKRGILEENTKSALVKNMITLNKNAAEVLAKHNITACTDVTGFGLLGHLKELSEGSCINAEINLAAIPLLPQTTEMALAGVIPGGTKDNLEYVGSKVSFHESINETSRYILADAQTSGGLLFTVQARDAKAILEDLRETGDKSATIIGKMTVAGSGVITVK
jgi:cysteine desulfurase